MNGDDKELLWRYRYALIKEPKALTKCLICVDWSAQHEVPSASLMPSMSACRPDIASPCWSFKAECWSRGTSNHSVTCGQVDQALDLLAEWEKMSTIDINDALQMLSADFTHPKVRMAAARRIAVADDSELVGYLLQLVQALRYEAVASDAPSNDSLLNLLGESFRPFYLTAVPRSLPVTCSPPQSSSFSPVCRVDRISSNVCNEEIKLICLSGSGTSSAKPGNSQFPALVYFLPAACRGRYERCQGTRAVLRESATTSDEDARED